MTQEWDETTWTQWAYFNDEGGLVSFDNKDAICAKTEFVQQHNLNGFIIWELSGVSLCLFHGFSNSDLLVIFWHVLTTGF
jgi:GH18 family chitinase